MADKWKKQQYFFEFQQSLISYYRKLPKFCDCSKKLNMMTYMISYTADLLIHVPIKYGRPNMADKWQKGVFLNFNHELSAIGRSCQNSITSVRKNISRAT